MDHVWDHTNPINDYSSYLRKKFPRRVQKISIDAGFTCPNRDGSRGEGGCTFCNNDSFNPEYCHPSKSIRQQVEEGISIFNKKYPDQDYLAYFQAYTNTYAPLSQLVEMYEEALCHPRVTGLVIGTRPDCLPGELIDYLASLQEKYYVVVELGIESTHEETLKRVNRGHTFKETREAMARLDEAGLPIGGHLILGLPGETEQMILSHAGEISKLPLSYLKLHQMQYVTGSKLGEAYKNAPRRFKVFEVEDYINLLINFLERLHPGIIIERLSSQAPGHLLLAPGWGLKNFEITRMVQKEMKRRQTWQGRLYENSIDSTLFQ
ncbi:MAG: TIGR01212 family radical SAM protein [Marinilabilia sp.]